MEEKRSGGAPAETPIAGDEGSIVIDGGDGNGEANTPLLLATKADRRAAASAASVARSAVAAASLMARPANRRRTLRIFLCRHGETDWNLKGRLQGQFSNCSRSGGGKGRAEEEADDRGFAEPEPEPEPEPSLNETGKRQARALAETIARACGEGAPPLLLRAVVSSDLSRARETADEIRARAADGTPLLVDSRLRERALGRATGFTREELREGGPEAAAALAGRGGSRVPAGPGGVYRRRLPEAAAAAAVSVAGDDPPCSSSRFLSFEEGESPGEVRSRVAAALASVAASFLAAPESGSGESRSGTETAAAAAASVAVAVVSHGGAISAAAAELFPGVPVPPRSANGSISEIVVAWRRIRRRKREKSKTRKKKIEYEAEEETERSCKGSRGEEEEAEEESAGGEDDDDERSGGKNGREPSFADFDWRLLRWGDTSHVPDARLSGGGAGAG